jgi:hypothetical protein
MIIPELRQQLEMTGLSLRSACAVYNSAFDAYWQEVNAVLKMNGDIPLTLIQNLSFKRRTLEAAKENLDAEYCYFRANTASVFQYYDTKLIDGPTAIQCDEILGKRHYNQ